jgi:hypothetical protein
VKKSQTGVKKIAELLEIAAKKSNESAEATRSVAIFFEHPGCDVSDGMLDRIFDAVRELAGVAMDGKPDYRRAARELLAKSGKRSKRA